MGHGVDFDVTVHMRLWAVNDHHSAVSRPARAVTTTVSADRAEGA
jgi:hypothetical protein